MRGKAKAKESPPCLGDIQDCAGMQVALGTRGTKSRWATSEDWSNHKDTIKRLYLTENRALWDVQEIMRTRYSFNATYAIFFCQRVLDLIFYFPKLLFANHTLSQSMYKKRLRSWCCSKYIVTSARPKQYMISWSAPGLVIKSPEIFRVPETILLCIQDYVNERRQNEGLQKAMEYQGATLPVQAHNRTTHALCREVLDAVFSNAKTGMDIDTFSASAAAFINSVEACRELLAEHHIQEAFSELRRLPAKIQVLLRDEPHNVLQGLFFAIIKMNWDGDDSEPENGILRAVLAYTAASAADSSLAWPETYPLRRILEGFSRMGNQADLAEVTIKCWKYFLDKLRPPGGETAGGCIISSFSMPRNFENLVETHEQPKQSPQTFSPAYKRLGIDKRRARYKFPTLSIHLPSVATCVAIVARSINVSF